MFASIEIISIECLMSIFRELNHGFIVILLCLKHIHGHGRMEEPPARNAAWRYGKYLFEQLIFKYIYIFLLWLGFKIPANYDDVGLNCGGLGVQKSNGIVEKRKFSKI